jgi:UDP-N-acetylglucosamine transferase subunit ALG13
VIFVTVGTHEQPFNRLVEGIDRLKEQGTIKQDVFIQSGYSSYKPRFCQFREFIRFDEMIKRIVEADIVVTHGGTGSIMIVLYHQKIPIVMPRQKKYNEHIDNHQLLFCKTLEAKGKIIAAYEIDDLEGIESQDVKGFESPGAPGLSEKAGIFSIRLDDLCAKLLNKK